MSAEPQKQGTYYTRSKRWLVSSRRYAFSRQWVGVDMMEYMECACIDSPRKFITKSIDGRLQIVMFTLVGPTLLCHGVYECLELFCQGHNVLKTWASFQTS